ncbi:MAG: hypothetical protein ABGZ17_04640 [Planctomycetaceae bacterium]
MCGTRDLERRRLICELGIQAAGGFDKFLRSWVAAIESLIARRQSSPRLIKMFELLWEMQIEQDRRRRAALENASDDDLRALIDERLDDWIKRDPEMVLVAARKLGWSLVPPTDPEVNVDPALAS